MSGIFWLFALYPENTQILCVGEKTSPVAIFLNTQMTVRIMHGCLRCGITEPCWRRILLILMHAGLQPAAQSTQEKITKPNQYKCVLQS